MINHRRWALLVMVALVASGIGFSQGSQDLLNKAKAFLERKQYTLAIETIEKALAADPKNAAALKLKEEASRLASEAEAAGKVDQMLVEAQAYFEAKQAAQAAKRLKEILALQPNHSEAQALLQRIELEQEMDLLQAELQTVSVREGDFVALDMVDEPPRIVKQMPPVYSSVAQRMGIEGEARFLATIGINGEVEEVRRLRRIEGWDDLNAAAEKAVKRYKFSPAKKGGVKVKTIVNLSVVFRLGLDVQAPHMK